MKFSLSIVAAFMLLFLTRTCNSSKSTAEETQISNREKMEITGTIQEQGMTSYQYGTHTITTSTDEFYALKSDAVDLNNYLNEEVTIVAEKIEGYPLSGGPDFLLVLEVK